MKIGTAALLTLILALWPLQVNGETISMTLELDPLKDDDPKARCNNVIHKTLSALLDPGVNMSKIRTAVTSYIKSKQSDGDL